jgi:hypothetical protein
MSNYISISNFGNVEKNLPVNDPLTYCLVPGLENGFLHGGIGPNLLNSESKECQLFMGDYCAKKWDDKCEWASNNQESFVSSMFSSHCNDIMKGIPLTKGDVLVRNTADRKYLTNMSSNCKLKYTPFDPTVSSSPMISWWESECPNSQCVPQYTIKPENLDNDPVMNKILAKPYIAMDILITIKNNMKKNKTFETLKGTKLYTYLNSVNFQNLIKVAMKQKSQNFTNSCSI